LNVNEKTFFFYLLLGNIAILVAIQLGKQRPVSRVHQEPSTFYKQLLPSVEVLHFGKK